MRELERSSVAFKEIDYALQLQLAGYEVQDVQILHVDCPSARVAFDKRSTAKSVEPCFASVSDLGVTSFENIEKAGLQFSEDKPPVFRVGRICLPLPEEGASGTRFVRLFRQTPPMQRAPAPQMRTKRMPHSGILSSFSAMWPWAVAAPCPPFPPRACRRRTASTATASPMTRWTSPRTQRSRRSTLARSRPPHRRPS